jgi:hypothetical protein
MPLSKEEKEDQEKNPSQSLKKKKLDSLLMTISQLSKPSPRVYLKRVK